MSASNTTAELARPRWWGKLSLVLFLLGIILPLVAWLICRPLGNASEAIYVAGGLVALLFFVLVVLLSRAAGWHAYMLRRLINFGIVFGLLGVGMGPRLATVISFALPGGWLSVAASSRGAGSRASLAPG